MNSIPLEEFNEPFLESAQDVSSDGPDFKYLATLPAAQKYTVQFKGKNVFIDSLDWRESKLLKVQVLVSFVTFALFGLADQTVGTIIPRLQEDYKINDFQTSFIFLASTTGYFILALVCQYLQQHFGVRGVEVAGVACIAMASFIISVRPPFAIFVMSFLLNGIGPGFLDASINAWAGAIVDSNQILGIIHGCYGIGCMISPPLVTMLMEKKHNPWLWNNYYVVLGIISVATLLCFIVSFRHETASKFRFNVILKDMKRKIADKAENAETGSMDDSTGYSDDETETTFVDALKSKLVWVFAICLFIYVGGEVAFGAWLVTFLIRIKKLSYEYSSWMATSFWLGLTVGRCVLGFVTAHFFQSELTANFSYIGLSMVGFAVFCLMALTSLNWILFPIVFITGLFVGPIFPTTIVASIEILPSRFHAASVGFICAFGGGGAAALPFLVGVVAHRSELGMKLQPFIVLALYVLLFVIWAAICRKYAGHKRRGIH